MKTTREAIWEQKLGEFRSWYFVGKMAGIVEDGFEVYL
jgi:hypothetical protein